MRSEFAPDTATPMRPKTPFGRPFPESCFQVVPPSLERYRPLPGPPLTNSQGERRASYMAAKIRLGLLGSKERSIAPVLSSLYKTFCQVAPPSVVRNTPR